MFSTEGKAKTLHFEPQLFSADPLKYYFQTKVTAIKNQRVSWFYVLA
jgi:hypothetical protein